MSVRIVEPVVVNPETDSNIALVTPPNSGCKAKGMEPNRQAVAQLRLTTRNPSRCERSPWARRKKKKQHGVENQRYE